MVGCRRARTGCVDPHNYLRALLLVFRPRGLLPHFCRCVPCWWQSVVPVNQAVWDHIFASDTTWGMRTIKIVRTHDTIIDKPRVFNPAFIRIDLS